MAIAGKIEDITFDPYTNEGYMFLSGEDRGQDRLWFINGTEEVFKLKGKLIWGGSSELYSGNKDTKIATREGYTKVRMTEDWHKHITFEK